jgi:hypothetical protein
MYLQQGHRIEKIDPNCFMLGLQECPFSVHASSRTQNQTSVFSVVSI